MDSQQGPPATPAKTETKWERVKHSVLGQFIFFALLGGGATVWVYEKLVEPPLRTSITEKAERIKSLDTELKEEKQRTKAVEAEIAQCGRDKAKLADDAETARIASERLIGFLRAQLIQVSNDVASAIPPATLNPMYTDGFREALVLAADHEDSEQQLVANAAIRLSGISTTTGVQEINSLPRTELSSTFAMVQSITDMIAMMGDINRLRLAAMNSVQSTHRAKLLAFDPRHAADFKEAIRKRSSIVPQVMDLCQTLVERPIQPGWNSNASASVSQFIKTNDLFHLP